MSGDGLTLLFMASMLGAMLWAVGILVGEVRYNDYVSITCFWLSGLFATGAVIILCVMAAMEITL